MKQVLQASLSVLVVDDHTSLRRLLRIVLEQAGYQTQEASSVPEAIAAITNKDFDAVLTDIALPGGGGFEIDSAIRRTCPRTAIVFMTGDTALQDYGTGVRHMLLKPFANEAVRQTIQAAIQAAADRCEATSMKEPS